MFAAAIVAAGLGGFVAPTESRAAEVQGIGLQSDDPSFISLGVGGFDVLHNETAGEFRAEYRSDYKLLGFLKPFGGVMGTTDRAFYGYGGFGIDLYFGSRWVLTPNAAVGFYERGSGKDLGSTIEFRTGAEFAYRFDDRSRLGLAFNHISNAGIDKRNPGEESLVLVYSIPFSLFK
jgi:lipid A 3-O-deacylase